MSVRLSTLLAILLLGAPAFAAEPAADTTGLPASMQETYLVGPRDVLKIEVYGEDDLTGNWTVGEDGLFTFPYIGKVRAVGLNVQEIAQVLTKRLLAFYVDPVVSVHVATFRSQSVEVNGAVKNSGEVFLTRPTRLLDVLGHAGVDTDKSNREVLVRHKDGTSVTVNLDTLFASGQGNISVTDGDVITVKEGQFVYVSGEVAKPGAILYQDGMTVAQALTKAGGPAQTARLTGAYLLRDGERVPVNLKRILDGRETDISMKPGDQLFLKESPI